MQPAKGKRVIQSSMLVLALVLAYLPILALGSQIAQAVPGDIALVSVPGPGIYGNENSWGSDISADGRYIAFASYADNLVAGDTNIIADIFVRDMQTGTVQRVNVSTSGVQADIDDASSDSFVISADGHYVAFVTAASTLVPGDTNGLRDLFVHDRLTNVTERIAEDVVSFDISGNGRFVLIGFRCHLVGEECVSSLIVYDRTTQSNIVLYDPLPAFSERRAIAISASGRFVAFATDDGHSPVPGDINDRYDVILHDRDADIDGVFDEPGSGEVSVELISINNAGQQGNNESGGPAVSDDGRMVAFASYADNLVAGDNNNLYDLFVRDRVAGTTVAVNVDSAGIPAGGYPSRHAISADGRVVAFETLANLLPADTNIAYDVYARNLQTGTTILVGIDSSGNPAPNGSYAPAISAGGQFITFASPDDLLVPGDTNGWNDVFRHEVASGGGGTPTNTPSSTATGSTTNTASRTPTNTSTNTPVLPTNTATWTSTATSTPTTTSTPTVTLTSTATGTATNTPVISTSTPTSTPTPVNCSNQPSFGPPTTYTAGPGPYFVTVGDFNGDGNPDLVTANINSNSVSVLLGTGTGAFGPPTNYGVGAQPRSIAVGDFNGDGNLDLVTANSNPIFPGGLWVLLGTGTGAFGPASSYAVGTYPSSVELGDFNEDGNLDLVATSGYGLNGLLLVLLGTGTGAFGPASSYAVGERPLSVAVGDFNEDGNLDLVATSGNNDINGLLLVLLGTGTGAFGPANSYTVAERPLSVAVGDFNEDGNLDLVATSESLFDLSVLLGTGTGAFGPETRYGAGIRSSSITVGDFNGDGNLDVVLDVARVHLGTGTGAFGPVSEFVSQSSGSVGVGDFNGDGGLDLVMPYYTYDHVIVLLNRCLGDTPTTTATSTSTATPTATYAPTNTPIPASNTPTNTAQPTATSTLTPTVTRTATVTPTPTIICTLLDNYQVTATSGATIVPGTSYVAGSTCNNCTVPLTLPFSYSFYGTTYTQAQISNKGTLQFVSNNLDGSNTCLPNVNFNDTIFAYWDDLNTNINDNMGVFTSVQGTAPNRIFTIEWRAGFISNDVRPRFEVRLYEGWPRFEMIYDQTRGGGFSTTIGVQKGTGERFVQYSCNTQNVVPIGTKLTFDQMVCQGSQAKP